MLSFLVVLSYFVLEKREHFFPTRRRAETRAGGRMTCFHPRALLRLKTTTSSREIPFFHLPHFSLTNATNGRQTRTRNTKVCPVSWSLSYSHLPSSILLYRPILSQQLWAHISEANEADWGLADPGETQTHVVAARGPVPVSNWSEQK